MTLRIILHAIELKLTAGCRLPGRKRNYVALIHATTAVGKKKVGLWWDSQTLSASECSSA